MSDKKESSILPFLISLAYFPALSIAFWYTEYLTLSSGVRLIKSIYLDPLGCCWLMLMVSWIFGAISQAKEGKKGLAKLLIVLAFALYWADTHTASGLFSSNGVDLLKGLLMPPYAWRSQEKVLCADFPAFLSLGEGFFLTMTNGCTGSISWL
jgi:hypothetical protein